MLRGDLYHTIGDCPIIKRVSKSNGACILKEMHEGICGAHIGVNALIRKVMWYEYFWPTMREEAKKMVGLCHKCQILDNDYYVPQNEYHSMSFRIPFTQWGMDI